MGSHQDGTLFTGFMGRLRFLILIAVVGVSSGIISHTFTAHLAKKEHAIRLEELTKIINAHRGQLEIREVDARSLQSAWDSFVGSIESGASAAASSILPNTTTILNGLVSLISGGGNTSTIVDSLQQPANSLGVGLSSGAMTGLNITMPKSAMASVNKTGLSGLALNLGSGLSSTIFSSSAVTNLFVMDPNQPGGTLGGSAGTVGQIALALAQGLGGGAVTGLKMATVNSTTSFNTSGINGVAGNFGQGLSETFLGGVQIPSLQSLIASFQTSNTTINFADVGSGVGTGIGQGAVVGLGLQADSSMNVSGIPGVAQGFTKGLVSSFLINGTASKLASMLSTSASASALFGGASANASASAGSGSANASAGFSFGGINVNDISFAKVAEGFAVGLVSGAGSTIMSLRLVSADTTNFDDSVQGASTGFGRGLGTEGSKIVQMVLSGSKAVTETTTTTTGMMGMGAMASTEVPVANPAAEMTSPKRSIKNLNLRTSKRMSSVALQPREVSLPNVTDLAGVLNNLNASAINPLTQYGIDKLTCTGVGGLVGLGYGLVKSGTIPLKISDLLKSMGGKNGFVVGGQNVTLPNSTFILKNEGNTYMLNPAEGAMTVMVNGSSLTKVIALAVVHILLAIVVFVAVLPSLLLLRSNDTFTALIFQPGSPKPPVKRWVLITSYSMIPLAIITFGTGVGLRGNAKHFGTWHGVLGLIVMLLVLVAGVAYPLAVRSPNPKVMLAHKGNVAVMLTLATTAIIAGISDLQSLAFCALGAVISPSVWLSLGGALTMQLALVQGVESLKIWLWWVERKVKKGKGASVGVKTLGGNTLKIEKIGLIPNPQERSSFKV